MMVYFGNTVNIQKVEKKIKSYLDPGNPKIGFPEISGKKKSRKNTNTNTEDQSAGPEPDPAPREAEVMEGSRKLST